MLDRMSPEFLYFDLGQVLLDFDHQRMFQQVAQVARLPEPVVRDWMVGKDLLTRFETGQVSTQQVYQEFCEATRSQSEFTAWLGAVSDIFSLKAEMVPLISQLRTANYRMGILSNTNAAHWDFVTDGRFPLIDQCFDLYALSFEIGVMKPDPRIYAAATEMAGVPPEKVLFVDDREENIRGAREVGWQVELMTTADAVSEALRARGVRFGE